MKTRSKGDGLSVQNTVTNAYGNSYQLTSASKSAQLDLPALMNIGLAYDFYLTKDTTGKLKTHRITVAGNFTSNSFTKDNLNKTAIYITFVTKNTVEERWNKNRTAGIKNIITVKTEQELYNLINKVNNYVI